jgi:hypothetical protein
MARVVNERVKLGQDRTRLISLTSRAGSLITSEPKVLA